AIAAAKRIAAAEGVTTAERVAATVATIAERHGPVPTGAGAVAHVREGEAAGRAAWGHSRDAAARPAVRRNRVVAAALAVQADVEQGFLDRQQVVTAAVHRLEFFDRPAAGAPFGERDLAILVRVDLCEPIGKVLRQLSGAVDDGPAIGLIVVRARTGW